MNSPLVVLRDMRPDEYDIYTEARDSEYVDSLAGALGVEAAREKARQDRARFLPQGLATPRHRLLVAENAAGEAVVQVWVGLDDPRTGEPEMAWLHDIRVAEAHRGTGHGRAILAAVEDLVRQAGAARLGLNVFGANAPAVSLYTRSGYEVLSQQMAKRLG